MRLPEQRWLRTVAAVTAAIFVGVAVYLYGFRFAEWIESDAAVTDVLAGKILTAHSPIVTNWYYANGDVWLLGAQLLAVVPVALLGMGTASLLVAVLSGFLVELVVFAKCYRHLAGEAWIGLFATMVTMMAWSNGHVAFGYIQLAYGFMTMLCMASFVTTTSLVGTRPSVKWLGLGLLIALIAAQNPTRTLVFIVAPTLAACAWPWRGVPVKTRLSIAGVVVIGWSIAYAVYTFIFARSVAFSTPRGHLDFAFAGFDGIAANLHYLARGLTVLCGGGSEPGILSIPGVVLMVGAVGLVVRQVLGSRAFTPLRFVAVIIVAQTCVVLIPLLFGNLLVDVPSVRYLMPSLLEMLGLGAIIAVRALAEAGRWRRVAAAWLVAVPITAAVAIPDTVPPAPQENIWPDPVELDAVAKQIVQRNLTRGYSNVLGANLLTMQTGGTALVCPIYMSAPLIPQRWLADTSCFTKATMPDRFFVVGYKNEKDRAAISGTLPHELEVFSVGPIYEVHVFDTATTSLAWLELPLIENDRSAFPMHIPATHLQLKRGKVVQQDNKMLATGETGTVLYGPYIKMPRGRYVLRWSGTGIPSPGEIKFLVVAGGKDIIREVSSLASKLPTTEGQLVEISFKLEAAREAMEFVVYSQDGGRVALEELVIERH